MEPHRLALPVGFQIEHFRIEAVLGKGGFGITYLAVDLQLGKRVAVKELLPDTIATRVEGLTVVPHSAGLEENWEWARERFLEEARTLATFSHPAIVGVHRLIEANGTVYMVMDYVEGESYEARLQRIGTEPDQESLMAVINPILSGLEEVHSHGLLHRDIKPENILIDKRGQPVLIDFGSARESVGKTMTMTSIVTHGYSPIEQYQTKGRMGPWTDIYAIAAVMCRSITGEKPPVATDRLVEDDFLWLSESNNRIFSAELRAAIDHGLRVRVQDRPVSIHEWKVKTTKGEGSPRAVNEVLDGSEETTIQPAPLASVYVPAVMLIAFVLYIVFTDYTGRKQRLLDREPPKLANSHVDQSGHSGNTPNKLGAHSPVLPQAGKSLQQRYQEAVELMIVDPSGGEELLIRAAEAGSVEAQYELGQLYRQARGNDGEAVKWYRKAADQGHALAQAALGLSYHAGKGVEEDPEEAVKWWRLAAEQGNAEAQQYLGHAYYSGTGCAQDSRQAVTWWTKAANLNDANAQYSLAFCYLKGEGVSEDVDKAVYWLTKATEQGSGEAQTHLGYIYFAGKQVGQDTQRALQLFRQAAEQGFPLAQAWLGFVLDQSPNDSAEAVKWLERAAEQGNSEAAEYLRNKQSNRSTKAPLYVFTTGYDEINYKLDRIILPSVTCRNASVEEVASLLQQLSLTHDPDLRVRSWKPSDGAGVRIVVAEEAKQLTASVDLNLDRVSLRQALKALYVSAKLNFKVTSDGVDLVPR